MADKINFEKSLKDLEEIVMKLESGEISLDESIELFSRGVKLAGDCEKSLNNAKLQIEKLTNSKEN